VRVGGTVDYELVLRNPAPEAITARWTHSLPVELDYVPGSATGGARYDAGSRMLSWDGTVDPDSALTFAFSAAVSAALADGTAITSTVTLMGGGCNPGKVSASVRAYAASLAPSTKVVDRRRAAEGDLLHYTITLANASPFTISNASLVDEIPEHTHLITESLTGGALYNPVLGRVEWTGSLAPAQAGILGFNWIDATSGQALALTDDSCVGPLELGFEFEFYGNRYKRIYVSSNGLVLFGKGSTSYSNTVLPAPAEPNNLIAALWDDLLPGTGKVYMATFGTAPQRFAVVEWHGVKAFNDSQTQTFEVVLFESSNVVALQYLDINGARGAGSSATVGIENADGSAGVQYLFNGSPAEHALHAGLALEMVHSSTIQRTTHVVAYDVAVDDHVPPLTVITNTARIDDGLMVHERSAVTAIDSPDLSTSRKEVAPNSVVAGETVTYTLHIVNSGTRDASALIVADTLPPELSLVPGSLTGGATYDDGSRQVRWSGALGMDPAGLTITYAATVQPDLPINTWITNSATLEEQGVHMGTLSAGLRVNPVILAESRKTAHASDVLAGSPITYTIRVRNTGSVTAPQASLMDVLPTSLEYVEGSAEGASYDAERRAIHWEGTLPAQGEHVVRFAAESDAKLINGTRITNTAEIADGNGGSLVRQASVRILRGDLSTSSMQVDRPEARAGEVVTYTLRLLNSGAASIGATLFCLPPAPLVVDPTTIYVSSGTVWWDAGLHWQGTLGAQALIIVRFSAHVSANASPQLVTTEAWLSDAGGLGTSLSAVLHVRRANETRVYLPQAYR